MAALSIGRNTPPDADNSLSAHATWFNGIVTTTQVPRTSPDSFELGDIEAQATRTLINLEEALSAAGSSMSDILHLTIYLTDINDWAGFNVSYTRLVPKPYPVRAAIGVKALAIDGMRVEVTAFAARRDE
jgi:enamine deaminase RidA (YjgF/YER057c/UK114 family)